MLVQTEVERVKFIVRSYVRTRLFKVGQYNIHKAHKPVTNLIARLKNSPGLSCRILKFRLASLLQNELTPAGLIISHLKTCCSYVLKRHANLTDKHFHFSVLQSLPETQSHLDDTPIFMPPMGKAYVKLWKQFHQYVSSHSTGWECSSLCTCTSWMRSNPFSRVLCFQFSVLTSIDRCS